MTKIKPAKSKNIKLTVVLPAYNEEARIYDSLILIKEFFATKDYEYEVLVSDDGSTDQTIDIVEGVSERWENLRILKNKHKGKAPAIISGIHDARGEFVLFSDVDLSVPINEIDKMMVWVEEKGYDVAIASREGTGAKRVNEPVMRHIMGRVFNYLVQLVILPGINDTQCGFKLFKNKVAIDIFNYTKLYSLNDPEITGAKVSGFDVELLYVARKLGYKIKSVPVVWTYADNSKVHNLKDSYYNAMDVFRVRLNSMKGFYNRAV